MSVLIYASIVIPANSFHLKMTCLAQVGLGLRWKMQTSFGACRTVKLLVPCRVTLTRGWVLA